MVDDWFGIQMMSVQFRLAPNVKDCGFNQAAKVTISLFYRLHLIQRSDDIRLQCFKYVGAGLATISLAAQVLVLESYSVHY